MTVDQIIDRLDAIRGRMTPSNPDRIAEAAYELGRLRQALQADADATREAQKTQGQRPVVTSPLG